MHSTGKVLMLLTKLECSIFVIESHDWNQISNQVAKGLKLDRIT